MNNKKKIIAMLFSFSTAIIGMEPDTNIASKCKVKLNSDVVAIIGNSLSAGKQWWYCSKTIPHGDHVRAVSLNGEGDILATGCDNGKVRIIDVNTGKELVSATHDDPHCNPVQALSLNAPGNGLFIKLHNEKQTRVFDVTQKKEVQVVPHDGEGYITFADKVCNEQWWSTQSVSGPLHIGRESGTLSIPHGGFVSKIDFNTDGNCLATGCSDGNARVFKRYTSYTLDQMELKAALNKWLLIEKPNKNITTLKRPNGEGGVVVVVLEKTVSEQLLFGDVAIKCGLDYNKAIVTWKSFPEDVQSSMFRTISARIDQHGKHGKDGVEYPRALPFLCNIQ